MTRVATLRSWGTIALVFLLPWQARWIAAVLGSYDNGAPNEWLTVSLFATELLAAVLAVVSFFDREFQQRVRGRVPRILTIAVIGLIALAFESVIWSAYPEIATQRGTALVLAVITVTLFLGHERPASLVNAFLASMSVQALLGIAQVVVGFSPPSTLLGIAYHSSGEGMASVVEGADLRVLRAYGTLPHPNVLGAFLAAAVLLAIDRYRREESFERRSALIGTLSVLVLACFLTFSRSAWIGLTIGMMPVAYAIIRERAGAHLLLPIALVPTVIAAVIFAPVLVGRLTGEGRLEARSISERIEGVEALYPAGGVLPERIVLGVGAGQWYEPIHAIPFQIYAELGVFALLLLGFVWFQLLERSHVSPLSFGLFLLLSTVSVFDHYLWTLWAGNLLAAFLIFLILQPADWGSAEL